ncbi:MAG: hypothetical protein JNL74_07750, partial [Fibrobacteres bacterium]|nr:hypothetical protein [Fibrobacterota bacterium]
RLPADTTVYISVTIPSIDGYYSRIVQDTNTAFRRTPRNPDREAIVMSAVTIDAARPTDAELLNGLYISYKLGNLDAIPQRDRSTMHIKVMWDTSDAYVLDPNLQIPGQEILYPADLLSNETSYRVVSRGVLPGRKYHVAAFALDTAGNWSTATRIKDTVSTPVNLAKPLNRTWSLAINGYNNIRINVPTEFFTDATPSSIDSNDLRGIGIWIIDTSASGYGSALNIDALLRSGGVGLGSEHRFIFLDSLQLVALDNPARGANRGVIDTSILRHNKRYNIICSPQNMFNNWGSAVLGSSQFYRATDFDSSLISRPPNKCQLTVTAMKDPDSVKVNWQIESNRYYDNDSLIKGYIDYDSVFLYYRTDGSVPTRVGNDSVAGVRIAAFDVNVNSTGGKLSVSGVSCSRTYRFAAFPVNTVSSAIGRMYGNRMASDTSIAQTGSVTPPCAPENFLSINASVDTGKAAAIRVDWIWKGGAAPAPDFIRFLYRAAPSDTFVSPPASYAASWVREDIPNASRATIGSIRLARSVNYKTLYVVAAFNAGTDTVWSKTSMVGQLGTLYDTVRTGSSDDTTAPSNSLTLKATALSSRSIELAWADPSNSLPGIDASENGNISLYYGIKTSPTAPYVWRQKYTASEFDSVRLSSALNAKKFVLKGDVDNINANKTYYLAIAPADSVGNVNGTPLIARDSVVLSVPNPSRSGVVIQALSDTAFSVDYRGLRTMPIAADSEFVKFAVFVVSDSAAAPSDLFEDPIKKQDLLNGLYDKSSRTGRTFLVKQRELGSTSSYNFGTAVSEKISLDNRKHYVSVSYMSGSELSPPVYIDTVKYRLDRPLFKSYSVRQINDSIVTLSFRPYDSTDVKVGVQVKYAVNPVSSSAPYYTFIPAQHFSSNFSGASGGQMTLDRDSTYTINLKLGTTRYQATSGSAAYFNGNDTNTLSIKFLVSDLHGPAPANSNDDSVVAPVRVDTRAPSPKDLSASVVFNYDPTPKKLTVLLTAKAGAVDYVRYKASDTARVWKDSVSMKSVTSNTIVIEPTDYCYLSLRDSMGNKYDTSWSFSSPVTYPITREPKTIVYDNGNIEITVSVNTIKDNVTSATDTLKMTAGKRTFTQAELDALRNGGYAAVPVSAYFFAARHGTLNSAGVWQEGLSLSAAIDTSVPDSLYDDVRVYRYDPSTMTAAFENSKIDNFGRLVVSGMKPPISDTLFYFIAVDTQKVRMDSLSLSYDKSERKLRLVVRGSDNSKALSGGVIILGHTVTGANKEYIRYNVNSVPGVAIDTTIVIPASDTLFDALLRRGLFGAAWVTDRESALLHRDRRAYSFIRCEYKADSMKLTFRNLFEGYQLVSLPVSLSEEYDDVLLALQDYSRGVYDRNKFRLYRLADDGVIKEFVATGYNGKGVQVDPDFRFGTGRSFFMKTRRQEENNVPVALADTVVSVPVNSKRGYFVGSRANSGWVICNVPFLGTVPMNDLQNTSSLRSTGSPLGNNKTVVPFGDRVFELASSGWRPMQQRSLSSGTGDIPASFAAYLYAGESLFVPVIPNNEEFISLGGRVAKSSTESSDWRVSALLYSGNGKLIDATAVMALSSDGEAELMDLPVLNDVNSRLSVVSSGRSLSYKQCKAGSDGEIWELEVVNGSSAASEYKVLFDDIAKNLPSDWQVWSDDAVKGYATDIVKSGAVSVVVPSHGVRVLRIVAGSPSFISKQLKVR